MTSKTFRIDWYPHAAFVDFSELEVEEIGVLMQIINLFYIKNGPIDNDAKHIGKSCNIGGKRCAGIISSLINKGVISFVEDGKISQNRCLLELETIRKRRLKYSKNGEIGAEKRWGNEQNQELGNDQAILDVMANTSTDKSRSKPTGTTDGVAHQEGGMLNRFGTNRNTSLNRCAGYNIDHHLSEKAREQARESAAGWCQQNLMRVYNKWIEEKHNGTPPKRPNAAYPAWCGSYTKGKPPP